MQGMAELRIVRHTDRFADACHFYGELLGWPVTKQWDEPSPGRIFGFGASARVELLSGDAAPSPGDGAAYLAVEVADARAVHRTLGEAGVAITQDLAEQPWGHRNFAVLDPTGTTVVFFEVIT